MEPLWDYLAALAAAGDAERRAAGLGPHRDGLALPRHLALGRTSGRGEDDGLRTGGSGERDVNRGNAVLATSVAPLTATKRGDAHVAISRARVQRTKLERVSEESRCAAQEID
eukprot:1107602-Prymnesium_polylepis.1